MTPIIEDAVLGSDLDGGFYSLLNVKSLDPVPPNLATSDDVRLSDVREPMPGSVTNVSVSATAAIDQSKINLNGQIPTAWLGTTPGTAAQGDLAEYLANKDQPNGYAGLDATGKIPTSRLPDAVGLATVSSVGLVMPGEFTVHGSPITTSGVFNVQWSDIGGPAWFGRIASGTGPPAMQTAAVPMALIPPLPAAAVTSGTFAPALLPIAKGVGTAAPRVGAVPDPGPGGVGISGTDYLGRDMIYHTAPTIAVAYQTTLPTPTLSVAPPTGARKVSVYYDQSVPANLDYTDAIFFYSQVSASAGFREFPPSTSGDGRTFVDIAAGQVWVYAAHPGYNNSPMTTQGP